MTIHKRISGVRTDLSRPVGIMIGDEDVINRSLPPINVSKHSATKKDIIH